VSEDKSIPTEIKESLEELYTNRRDILQGLKGTYMFKPIEIMKDAEKANKATVGMVTDAANAEKKNIADFVTSNKTANGISALARDHLAASKDRVASIVTYLNELNTEIEGAFIGTKIPGYTEGGEK
jgi:hypothetical protein